MFQDAKESKQNEIDELRSRNHSLEEENMRLQIEINQLQRTQRRNSPTIKDEPLSPTNSSSPSTSTSYKASVPAHTEDWSRGFNRRGSKTTAESKSTSVQNLIESFNPKSDEKNDSNSSTSTSGSTSERVVPVVPVPNSSVASERRKLSEMRENDKQARNRLTERVKELRKKASERPQSSESKVSRRPSVAASGQSTSSLENSGIQLESTPYYPSISSDPLSKLSKKYGGSKRNSLLKWCQEQLNDYQEIEVTNFSTTWSDGLALCALLHSRLPLNVPYRSLVQGEFNKRKNVETALKACQVLGISSNNLPSGEYHILSYTFENK